MIPGRSDILGEYAVNPPVPASGFGGQTIATGWCSKCRVVRPVGEELDCPTCGCQTKVREWRCSALEDALTAQFEDEVRRRARRAYVDIQRSDPEGAADLRSAYTSDFSAGAYNWDDEGANATNHVRTARTKTWGALYLLFLLMRRCDPSVTEKQAREVWLASPDDAMRVYLWALGVVGNRQAPPPAVTSGADASGSTNGTRVVGPPMPPSTVETSNPPEQATFG